MDFQKDRVSKWDSFVFIAALNPKFRYAVGQAYTYNFQANSKTWMMGTSEDQAILTVTGQAVVTFRTPCEAVVQLRKTVIEGLDDSVNFLGFLYTILIASLTINNNK